MGNSEVGPPHDRLGPDPLPGPRAREPGRRGRLALRERGARSARSGARRSATATVHLLGLVSTGGVHSHIDHLRALLDARRPRGDGGADVDPRLHRRPRRLAARRRRRPGDAAARPDRDRRRALLRDGPRQALGANRPRARRDRRRRRREGGRSGRRGARELRARRDRRVRRAGRAPRPAPARSREGRRDRLQLPARPRPPADAAAARGERRRRHDDALQRRLRLPGRVRRADGARHARARR